MISDKGYSLTRRNRHELRYETQGKTLTLEVEESASSVGDLNQPVGKLLKDLLAVIKARKDGLSIYLSQVQSWDAPHQTEEIGEQELALIRDHVREGMKFLGIKCSFE